MDQEILSPAETAAWIESGAGKDALDAIAARSGFQAISESPENQLDL